MRRPGPGTIQVSARRSRLRAYAALANPGLRIGLEAGWDCGSALPLPLFSATYCTRDLPRTCGPARPYVSWTPANGDVFFIPRRRSLSLSSSSATWSLNWSCRVANRASISMGRWNGRSTPWNPTVWCGCPGKINCARCSANTSCLWILRWRFCGHCQRPRQGLPHRSRADAADAYARAALYVLGSSGATQHRQLIMATRHAA